MLFSSQQNVLFSFLNTYTHAKVAYQGKHTNTHTHTQIGKQSDRRHWHKHTPRSYPRIIFKVCFWSQEATEEVRRCRQEDGAEDNAQPLISSLRNPKQQEVLSHQRVKVVTGKRRFEWYIHISNAVMHFMSAHTHTHAGRECKHARIDTHLLMLCRSWRAASRVTRGFATLFPWRPVQRSWSLNLGCPLLSAFWRVWCHYNGKKPAPVGTSANKRMWTNWTQLFSSVNLTMFLF